jgi:RNA-binding protein
MNPLPPSQRRELLAQAHHLHPVVIVGHLGLTPAVIHEIDVNLLAHELIKVRVFADGREDREAILERICTALDASPVQHIGKLLVLWRPAPDEPKQGAATTHAKRATAKAKTMAKSTPQARRPRSPLARTAARGKTQRAPSSLTRTPSEQARRRRRGA